jgi:WD40-like Beta Propeller Repeat
VADERERKQQAPRRAPQAAFAGDGGLAVAGELACVVARRTHDRLLERTEPVVREPRHGRCSSSGPVQPRVLLLALLVAERPPDRLSARRRAGGEGGAGGAGRGGKPRVVVPTNRGGGGAPSWSPDGRFLVFNRGYLPHPYQELAVVSANGGPQRRLTTDFVDDSMASWGR